MQRQSKSKPKLQKDIITERQSDTNTELWKGQVT